MSVSFLCRALILMFVISSKAVYGQYFSTFAVGPTLKGQWGEEGGLNSFYWQSGLNAQLCIKNRHGLNLQFAYDRFGMQQKDGNLGPEGGGSGYSFFCGHRFVLRKWGSVLLVLESGLGYARQSEEWSFPVAPEYFPGANRLTERGWMGVNPQFLIQLAPSWHIQLVPVEFLFGRVFRDESRSIFKASPHAYAGLFWSPALGNAKLESSRKYEFGAEGEERN